MNPDDRMDPRTPPSYRNGQYSPPTSTTPSQEDHATNSKPVYSFTPISPPPSTGPSQQFHASNSRSVHGFSPLSRSATVSQTQSQMAIYYDGAQMADPPPTVCSPELMPSQQIPESENPKYKEWLRQQALEDLKKKKRQRQQTPPRTQTPERQYSQEQDSEQQPFSRPQSEPQQRQHPQQWRTEPQSYPQQERYASQQSYPQQNALHRSFTEQEPDPRPHYTDQRYPQSQPEPRYQHHPQQRSYSMQQPYTQHPQDLYFDDRYQQYPRANLPQPLMRQMQPGIDSGRTSRNTTIDDYVSRVPPSYFHQGFQGFPMNMNFMPEQAVSGPTGHRYGKLTIKDDAKVLMGNGVDPALNLKPVYHEYGDVEVANQSNLHQGDLSVHHFDKFFSRSNTSASASTSPDEHTPRR